jgi:hypothetical protein
MNGAGRLPPAAIAAVALGIAALPAPARALCPNCLAQNDGWTPTLMLVGAFLCVPFLVFLIVLFAVRRALRARIFPR